MTVMTPVATHTAEEPAAGANVAGDIGRDDEDARADHGAHDEHGGVEQAQTLLKADVIVMR